MDTLGGVTNIDFRFKMREAKNFFWDAFPKEKKGHFEPKSASQGQKMLYGSLFRKSSDKFLKVSDKFLKVSDKFIKVSDKFVKVSKSFQ